MAACGASARTDRLGTASHTRANAPHVAAVWVVVSRTVSFSGFFTTPTLLAGFEPEFRLTL
jgi:hypothetical protein